MQLLLTILVTLLAGTLVVLVPGAGLLATTRLDRIVPPPLMPAAALAVGLVPLAALTASSLLLRQPIEAVAIGMGLVVLASWGTLAARARTEARSTRSRARARGWLAGPRALVAGEWLRGTPVPALAMAAVGGALAILVGFYAWNDSLYHIGQAQKLLALDAPSFTNTLQFPDGSAHPGYFVPAWQEAIALTAWVARVDPVTAAWILPGITLPVGMLAIGGLAWSLTRSRAAASVGTAALLVTGIANLPTPDPIMNAMHPGVVALGILAPLVFAMLFTALWPEPWRDAGDVGPRTTTRAATLLAVVAVAGIGMLHVSYLWVLGLGVLGYYLHWALRAPWPRAIVARHLATGTAIAVVAVACIALLFPGLARLEGLGRDARTELAANDSEQYRGGNAANLDAVLRGDPEERFHLRADYLVLAGGLALVGLLVIPATLLAPRWPGGWYLTGSATLVLGIALSDVLFPGFVRVVTLDQARRIERVLPLVPALAMGALAVGAAAAALWRRRSLRMRAAAAGVPAMAAALLAIAAWRVPPLAGYGGEQIVEPRVIVAVLVVLIAGTAALVGWLLLRLARRRPIEADVSGGRLPLASWKWPTQLLGPASAAVATLVLIVGATPVYGRIGNVVSPTRLERLPADMRTAEMRLFAPRVADVLRDLPTGATVLADPRTRNPYIVLAIAPVYVVSSVPRHTALTPENRVSERFERAVSFFEGDLETGLSLQERIDLLLEEEVDAIVVHPFASRPVIDALEGQPGVREAAGGRNQKVLLVDRDELARHAGRTSGTDRVS